MAFLDYAGLSHFLNKLKTIFPLASTKGVANGIATLDESGKVPSSQLPSSVNNIVECASLQDFPTVGESGKIYVAKDTNLTYRWAGSAYVEISKSIELGTTNTTAFRGDQGYVAYNHATSKGSAFQNGFYKITTNEQGHVTSASAVTKTDITDLGIPGEDTDTHRPIQVNGVQNLGNDTTVLNLKNGNNVSISANGGEVTISATDTTYSNATTSQSGLMSAEDKTKLNGIANGATANIGTITGINMNGSSKGTSGVVDLGTVLTEHQDVSWAAPKESPVFTGSISLGRKENTDVGENSFAVGDDVEASGTCSHAEGMFTRAEGDYSHAEGFSAFADETFSHAEGVSTAARGEASHAEGYYTIANGANQHAGGKFNVADSTSLEIIGNGSAANARKNARLLDANGNERLKGDVYVNCNDDSTGGNKLATETYVGTYVGNYVGTYVTPEISSKADINSPNLTGTPTAPTAADGTSTTQIATTAFVMNAFKANDAMIFKGTIGSSGATVTSLPDTHYQGWTYKVIAAGSYAGQQCEIGDMIICIADGTTASNADWTVVQSNIDGAVTGPVSSTNNNVVLFDGTSGKTIKDSGFTIGKSVPSNAVFTDTKVTTAGNHYTPSRDTSADKTASASGATAAWSIDVVKGITLQTDGKGHVVDVAVTSGKIPANPNTDTKVTSAANHYAPATVSGSEIAADATGATAAWSIDVVKGVSLSTDGKGHVTGINVTSGKIPANPNTDIKVRQTLSSESVNRPLLLGYSSISDTTSNIDNTSIRNNRIYANPSSGYVTAINFVGKINNHTVASDVPAFTSSDAGKFLTINSSGAIVATTMSVWQGGSY